MPETTPILGLQAPLGSDPISQGDDLMRANNVILEDSVTDLQGAMPTPGPGFGLRIVTLTVTTDATGYVTIPWATIGIDNASGDARLTGSLQFSKTSTGGTEGSQPHWAEFRAISPGVEVVIYSMTNSGAELGQQVTRYAGQQAQVTVWVWGRLI